VQSVCCEIVWPTSTTGRQTLLSKRVIAFYFCQAHDVDTLSVTNFIQSLIQQLSSSTVGFVCTRSQDEWLSGQGNADEFFMSCVVQPLQAVPPPADKHLIIVDSVDESVLQPVDERTEGSKTIAELLAKHCHLLPSWLTVICSARRQSRTITKLFSGFRKICLDDLRKPYIVRDIQQYILSRLDREVELRQHLSRETAEMLNQLHIKSNGCFLYVETVLNGVADGCLQLKEVRDIPGTLNGLYLWLCQRMFAKNSFATVQPVLNVMLAARRPLTAMELYSCMYTTDTSLTFDNFQHHLQTIAALLVEGSDGTKIFFHHSFAEWLLDVKHCTPKYLCSAAAGHSMLAMSFSMHAAGLAPVEIQDFALHLTKSDFGPGVTYDHLSLLLIQSGANVSESLSRGWPKEPAVAALLKSAGANVDIDPNVMCRQTAIPAALSASGTGNIGQNGSSKIVMQDSIIKANSVDQDLSDVDTNEWFTAIQEGNTNVVRRLIKKGQQVNCVDEAGMRGVDIAAKQGSVDMVKCLIEAGANINTPTSDGWSALRLAAWSGHVAVLRALLAAGADIDACDPEGRSALRCAAWGGQCETARVLVEHGALVDGEDSEGRTPLTAAVFMGHLSMVDFLLSVGANVNHVDIDGRTALFVAAMRMPANVDIASALIEAGATVDSEDKHGMTALLVAAYEGNDAICELLLDGDADVDHMDSNGRTALQAAVSMGHSTVVSLLLFWGAAVDTIDNEGRTVLCLAAQQGNMFIVSELLSRGLDEMHRDNSGLTPLHIAAFEGHREVNTCCVVCDLYQDTCV
jgi:ankyrin repeat protein